MTKKSRQFWFDLENFYINFFFCFVILPFPCYGINHNKHIPDWKACNVQILKWSRNWGLITRWMKSNEKFTFYKKCRWKKYFEVWSEKLTTINFCLSLVLKFQEKKLFAAFFWKEIIPQYRIVMVIFFSMSNWKTNFLLNWFFFLFCPVKFKKKNPEIESSCYRFQPT